MNRLAPLALALMVACDGDDDVVWRQFNNVSDSLTIEIVTGDPGEAVTTDITSNTGERVVGSAVVDPGSGPIETTHRLILDVDDEWQERIGRATITSTGERGDEEYDLRQDSADHGVFDLTLTSLGEPGETRSDVWIITLWEPIENPPAEFQEEGQ